MARSEQIITDDEKFRFLIELMLTDTWSDEFETYVKAPNDMEYFDYTGEKRKQIYLSHIRFCDYMHNLGLIKWSKSNENVYVISERGRQFLNRYKRRK